MVSPVDYLHPRYWLSWVGFGLLRLISFLPLPIITMMGTALGSLFFYLKKSRRQIAIQNLAACFPELSEQQHNALAKRCFQLIAATTLSVGINWWASPARLQRLVSYEGKPYFEEAVAQGRNIILLAPHVIALEIAGLLLSRERSMISMYQHTRKKLLNDFVKNGRGRFGGIMVERREPMRALLKLIRAGYPFYYLPDQDAGDKGVFVPFFGIDTSTYPMLPKFAKIGNAIVLPIYTHILPNGAGWRVVIDKPLENYPSGDEMEDTRRMNEVIETMIRTAPDQYLWIHKRFKTRPPGDDSFYN